MTKIQQMLDAGISVIQSQSNEALGQYSYSSLSAEQIKICEDIINPPTVAQLAAKARKENAKANAGKVVEIKSMTANQANHYIDTNITTHGWIDTSL